MTTDAFAGTAYGSGTEAAIVDALRRDGALSLSLVAEEGGKILGHVAFSPVRAGSVPSGWYGLGPVSVRPDRQGQGIGAALIRDGLARLKSAGAAGCVVLGNPTYYRRFGFVNDPALRLEGVPQDYFMRLLFRGESPEGAVTYHPAFDDG